MTNYADLDQELATNPNNVEALLQRGSAYLNKHQAEKALKDFQKAAEICQNATNLDEKQRIQILFAINLYLSQSALQAGELETALHAADQAIELKPDALEGLLQRAQIWVVGVNWDEAQNDLEQAFGASEEGNQIVCLYAMVQYQMGDAESAFATMNDAVEQYANDAQVWLARGELHLADGNFSQAKKDFLKAVKLDKTSPYAYPYLGYFALRDGKLDGAEEILLAGLRYAAQNPELHLQLAHVYLAQQRWQDALDEAEQYLKLKPHGGAGWSAQAFAYQQLGQHEDAYESSRQAAEYTPQDATILYQHALLALQTNRTQQALEILSEHLLPLQPSHMDAHRLHAEILAGAGFDLFWRVLQTDDYDHLVTAWEVLNQIADEFYPDASVNMLPMQSGDSEPFLGIRLAISDAHIDIWVEEHYQINLVTDQLFETSAPLDAKMLLGTVKESIQEGNFPLSENN